MIGAGHGGLPQVFVDGLILAGLGWCIQCLGPAVYPRISHVDGRGVNLTIQVHVKPLFVFYHTIGQTSHMAKPNIKGWKYYTFLPRR